MKYANVSGVWKPADGIYANIGGSWKAIEEEWVNVGGVWSKSYTMAGIDWVGRVSANDSYNWNSVCYGKGLFVAVAPGDPGAGIADRVMTSPDGVNWTLRSGPVIKYGSWQSVCYGNGRFVAVSDWGLNNSMYSINGIDWEFGGYVNDNAWARVCFGNGVFVVISYNSHSSTQRVMTSTDGIDWTLRSHPSGEWRGICYGADKFVAVGEPGAVMTSSDGTTWTTRTSSTINYWSSICYGNGIYVVVAGSGTGNRVMTSPDGVTWTSRTSAADNNWASVCYSDTLGLFVAVSKDGVGNRVMTSPDGITWKTRASASNNEWTSVCEGGGTVVAVSQTGTNRVMTSIAS